MDSTTEGASQDSRILSMLHRLSAQMIGVTTVDLNKPNPFDELDDGPSSSSQNDPEPDFYTVFHLADAKVDANTADPTLVLTIRGDLVPSDADELFGQRVNFTRFRPSKPEVSKQVVNFEEQHIPDQYSWDGLETASRDVLQDVHEQWVDRRREVVYSGQAGDIMVCYSWITNPSRPTPMENDLRRIGGHTGTQLAGSSGQQPSVWTSGTQAEESDSFRGELRFVILPSTPFIMKKLSHTPSSDLTSPAV